MKSLNNFLDTDGRLTKFPSKRPMQAEALRYLACKFEPDKEYSEREVNELLLGWHTFGDSATLRRELYDGRYLDRDPYGRSYRLNEGFLEALDEGAGSTQK